MGLVTVFLARDDHGPEGIGAPGLGSNRVGARLQNVAGVIEPAPIGRPGSLKVIPVGDPIKIDCGCGVVLPRAAPPFDLMARRSRRRSKVTQRRRL